MLTAASATLADAVAPDERVSSELKTNIMKARLEKKMTQAQLAQVWRQVGPPLHRLRVPARRSKSTSCRRLCRTTKRARPFLTLRCVLMLVL